MRPLSILVLLGCALMAGSCADPMEQRSASEVGDQLKSGVTGQGKLGPIDRPADDRADEHGIPQTHP
jgi:hypothetical protein